MNKIAKFDILRQMSGNFLTSRIPENWESMDEHEQDTFLCEHAWEPLENHGYSEVWEIIENATDDMCAFLNSKLRISITDDE